MSSSIGKLPGIIDTSARVREISRAIGPFQDKIKIEVIAIASFASSISHTPMWYDDGS